ncbi:Diadenosine tetraphosphate (Ap4A) hydrolase [gamma proteobacterium IMCC2047]|nr:Diadenosine tetraphosphate (Ap4A) hydrolase [gamma proteobacterium IMCC2047]
MVPQLHVHHIVRYKHDAAWPAPVWGAVEPVEYSNEVLEEISRQIFDKLGEHFQPLNR